MSEKEALLGLAEAITAAFTTPDRLDRNMEPANVADEIGRVADAIYELAEAVRLRYGRD